MLFKPRMGFGHNARINPLIYYYIGLYGFITLNYSYLGSDAFKNSVHCGRVINQAYCILGRLNDYRSLNLACLLVYK